MTLRPRWLALATLAVLCANRADGGTLDLTLSLGAGYQRRDTGAAGTPWYDSQTWDWNGGLGISYSPLSPGLLTLSGDVNYRDMRTADFAASSRSENLTYQGSATSTLGPISLSYSAGRQQADFTSQGGTDTTGTTRSESQTVAVGFTAPGLPIVRALWLQSDYANYFTGRPDSRGRIDTLQVQARHSVPTQSYAVDYRTNWSSGTRAQTNYQNHALNLQTEASISQDLRLYLSDYYYLRDPTLSDPSNPRVDSNVVSFGATWMPSPRLSSWANYSYSRSLGQAPGTLDQENGAHALSLNADYRLDQQWALVPALTISYAHSRLGQSHYQATSEVLGLSARWNPTLGARQSLTVTGGGSIGLAQTGVGEDVLAYAVNGSVFYGFPIGSWSGSAGYTLNFADGNGPLQTTALSQRLSGTATGAAWPGATTSVQIQAQSSRLSSPVAGTSYSRSARVEGNLTWKGYHLGLNVGAADSLSDDLHPGFADGLFFSPGFNNHSRYATLYLDVAFAFNLTIGAQLSHIVSEPVNAPQTSEEGIHLTVQYLLGEWRLILDDRFTYSSVSSGPWTQTNLFFVRLGRSFNFHR